MTRLRELSLELDEARRHGGPVDDLLRQIYSELDKIAISRGIAPRYAAHAYSDNSRPKAGKDKNNNAA